MSEERPAPDASEPDPRPADAPDAPSRPGAVDVPKPDAAPEREAVPDPGAAPESGPDDKSEAVDAPEPVPVGEPEPEPQPEPEPDPGAGSAERPGRGDPDDDAWAAAAAEDLESEQARRRARYGPPPGSAAEELRKLVDAVTDKLSDLRAPLEAVAGPATQHVVRQVVQQAKAVVEPVIERNPDVFDHLAAAGGELLAAYRSAVQAQERRWTTGDPEPARTHTRDDAGDDDGPGGGPAHHIDLD